MISDDIIKQQAEEFARTNKKRLAIGLTDISKFLPDGMPISVFMAGSPGAGKTEFSKRLIESLEKNKNHKVIRIDSDDLRSLIPGYTGANSYLFQSAVSIIVEKIHDLALENKQTFLLDGTLSKYDKASKNIERSLSKNRPVVIFYVYQTPEVAWRFTQARETLEGRNIPKEAFIREFLGSKDTINLIHKNFGNKLALFLVKKNFEAHTVDSITFIEQSEKQIDDYLEHVYTKAELNKILQ